MFIEFQFGNFRSFRDDVTLSMVAASTQQRGGNDQNVFLAEDLRILKTKGIYGQNASGKSNIVKAIAAFNLMVAKSVSKENIPDQIWKDRFQLLTDWDDQSMYFQYLFLLDETFYRYGFQIVAGKVSSEWLFGKKGAAEVQYFLREGSNIEIDEDNFSGINYGELLNSSENEVFRTDSLFLTGSSLTGNKFSAKLRSEIMKTVITDGANDKFQARYAMEVLEKGTKIQIDALKSFLTAADVGIVDLVLDELKDGESESAEDDNTEDVGNRKPVALFSKHAKYDEKGNMVTRVSVFFPKWESGGTKKLFGLAAIVLQALEHGHTIIIDELDAKLHPNLTLKIVQLFHSDATNPHNAQLIFVTHDTGLLKRGSLCLDQICLVDKDIYGLSSLKTLIEYKINTTGGNPNAIGEEYEEGVFGAVPFLNSIDSVIFEMLAANGVQNTD